MIGEYEKNFLGLNNDVAFINIPPIGNQEEPPMTVCIAAIAENGQSIILAADNASVSTIAGGLPIATKDPNTRKTFELAPSVRALFSGAPDIWAAISRDIQPAIEKESSAYAISLIVRGGLEKHYLNTVEQLFLRRFNLTWASFIESQSKLSHELIDDLMKKINSANLEAQIIVAGYNGTSPHLALIGGNGIIQERTQDGFVSVGSGADLARLSLVSSAYNKNLAREKAESLVRQAMLDAQKCPGIGDIGEFLIIKAPLNPQPPKAS